MMKQKKNFLESEGNKWFARNNLNINDDSNIKKDTILRIMSKSKISKKCFRNWLC